MRLPNPEYISRGPIFEKPVTRSSLSLLLRVWRAACVVAIVACSTSQRASAGCGDYVTILNASAASPHDAMSAMDDRGGTETPVRPPCQGPNCSSSPTRQVPPPAPPVPTGQQVKDRVQRLELIGDADTPRESINTDNTSLRPIRRGSSIFHPPRD